MSQSMFRPALAAAALSLLATAACGEVLTADDAVCGDGVVATGEACDDGDTAAGDGCSATCAVEDGFTCSGEPSACAVTCGDGLILGDEACDDGDTGDGDGCSAGCVVEDGFVCDGEPSVCEPGAPEISVTVRGTEVASGDILAFAEIDVGATDSIDVVVANEGDGPLTLDDVSITGADTPHFSLAFAGPLEPIAAGESITLTAVFAPGNGGLKRATLSIDSDDADEAPFELVLDAHTTGNTYRDITPASGPSGRFNHQMVDLGDGRLLLFGGRDAAGNRLNDTWLYEVEANAWSQLFPAAAPSPRDAHALAVVGPGLVLLFGGSTTAGGSASLGDTWLFDLATTTWTPLMTSGAPPARLQGGMVALGGGRALLHGGRTTSNGTEVNDTWQFDLATNTWTNLSPVAPPSVSSAFALDANGAVVVRVGGFASATPTADTWVYDVAANTWSLLTPAGGTTPGARAVHNGAFFAGGQFVLHSGKLDGCCIDPTAGTFALDVATSTWTVITPASEPVARFNYSLTYVAGSNKAIVFGGLLQNTGVGTALTTVYEYVGPRP